MKVHNPFRVAFIATLGVGLGILVITSVQTLSTILLYVGTALFLSLGLDPIISWLERRRLPRWAAVLITILAVLLAFAGIVLMVLPIIVGQVTQLVIEIQDYLQSISFEDFLNQIKSLFPGIDPVIIVDALGNIQDWLLQNWGSITGGIINASLAFVVGLGGAFIVLILTIYFTASTPNLKKAVYQLVPASRRERFVDLAEQITASVGYYVIGQLSLGVINGILSAILLTIIGAPLIATGAAAVRHCFSEARVIAQASRFGTREVAEP